MSSFFRFFFGGFLFIRPARSCKIVLASFCALLAAALPLRAQSGTPIRIDASAPYVEPGPALYDTGSSRAPSGAVLGVNSRYLTLDGKPWLPVMGEFHFSRYPRDEWETEILKMKAAGVNIVSTYVIWIHHEEIRDRFDWKGQRDLRAFAQLCAKHDMLLVPRIGPWDHAEVRNGGLPDWVLQQGPTRVNDPVYLASVRAWYSQVALQLHGLLWKDGGPVIGVQLENEYSARGPGAGADHILELKKIALDNGLDVPLYFVTGWDKATVPPRAVLPVYGGYPDAPWDGSIHKLPPAEVYAFRFQRRDQAVNQAAHPQPASTDPDPIAQIVPYLTAEIGGGIEDTYHRRPVIAPDDIAAMVPVMLGSGVNLYGTYMFHGGENPDGKLSTLQESQATGYPNDLPIKSYDFQAPLSEFGQERASLRKLKVFDYFLNDFGADLAPMAVHAPEEVPSSPSDLSIPRTSVRSNGDSGFIFFNNYVRGAAPPARPAVQFLVQLPSGMLAVPRHPVDLPTGSYFIWPFDLRVSGINLRYSTAQLFTRLENNGVTTLYFEAIPSIPAEFSFDAQTVSSVHSATGDTRRIGGDIDIIGVESGIDSPIELTATSGKTLRIVVLTAQQAEDAWKIRLDGADRLLITAQDFVTDRDSTPARTMLQSLGSPHFDFTLTPPLAAPPPSSLPLTQVAAGKFAQRFTADATSRKVELTTRKLQSAGQVPPVKLGPAASWRSVRVAQAPPATDLPQAAKWSITVPPGSTAGLSQLFLEVSYKGDLARFYANRRLLDDDFFNGQPWFIGLNHFLDPRGDGTFELDILPLRADAPIYLEDPSALTDARNGQVDTLDSIKLVPQYQLELGVSDQCPSTAQSTHPAAHSQQGCF